MSRNLIEATETLFNNLVKRIEDEYINRIVDVERRIVLDENEEINSEICSIIQYAKLETFIYGRESILLVKHNEDFFTLINAQNREIIEHFDCEAVDDERIIKAVTILGMIEDSLEYKYKDSIIIIERILGIEGNPYIEFNYEEINDIFEDYLVLELNNIEFKEDLHRLYGMLIAQYSALLTTECRELILDILQLKSSRGVALTLIDVLKSDTYAHKYLMAYQCLEYLFLICYSDEIISKYSINADSKPKIVQIVTDENIRVTEIDNLTRVINKYASDISINIYFDLFLKERIGDIDDMPRKKQKVAKDIYETRCNIAHLKYNQNRLFENYPWIENIHKLLAIIFSVYVNMDITILEICKLSDIFSDFQLQ